MLTRLVWKSMSRQERIDAITALAEQKKSASQIAAYFVGVSRNAIIGYANRWDIPLKSRAVNPARRRAASPRPKPPRPVGNKASAPLPEPPPTPTPEMALPFFEAITSRDRCKWPLWGEDQSVGDCCGAIRMEDSPYCEFHSRISVGRGTEGERTALKVLEKMS